MKSAPRINIDDLKRIVKEEVEAAKAAALTNESVDHKGINSVVAVASKLLAAVEAFKEKAPPAAINALTPGLGQLEKVLEAMLETPSSYVPKLKVEPKRVSLKAVKGSS